MLINRIYRKLPNFLHFNTSMKIKNFTETDVEFDHITRLYNLVSHDDKEHVDDMKEGWAVIDRSLQRDRLLLYDGDNVLGYLGYAQGRDENHRNCYFNIFLDPQYNGNGYRQILYDRMREEIKTFDCNKLYADLYEHPNYEEYKKFLLKNKFSIGLKIREYSLWTHPGLFSMILVSMDFEALNGNSRVQDASHRVLALAHEMGGSMEYVHGVGTKLSYLMEEEMGSGLEFLRTIKETIDPNNIMNPGKMGL